MEIKNLNCVLKSIYLEKIRKMNLCFLKNINFSDVRWPHVWDPCITQTQDMRNVYLLFKIQLHIQRPQISQKIISIWHNWEQKIANENAVFLVACDIYVLTKFSLIWQFYIRPRLLVKQGFLEKSFFQYAIQKIKTYGMKAV